MWIAITASFSVSPRAVRADAPSCGRAGRPWITVAFAGEAWTQAMRAAVLADLRAGLRLRGIDACTLGTSGNEAPLALLELQAASDERVAVSIELHDALTEKRVVRDADLHAVSPDARALAIAAAADELLRASWAELALSDAPPTSRPAPEEVQQAVRTTWTPARVGATRDHELGARAALEYFGGGVTLLGGDVVLGLWPDARIGGQLALGLRSGLRKTARAGAIDTRALIGALDAQFALLPRTERFGLRATVGVSVASIGMRGVDVAPGTIGKRGDAWDVHARAGLGASIALTKELLLRADAGVGFALQSTAAREDGHVVASTGGAQLLAALGMQARF